MTDSSTPYAPQIKIPELLERGRTQTTVLSVYRDGAIITPSSATYTLLDPNGIKIVDGAVVTIAAGVMSYTHSALPDTTSLGEGYLQEWIVTLPAGNVATFRRTTAVVLRRLYPVVSDMDLTSTYSQLTRLRPSTLTSYQSYIDEAWYQIIQKLRQEGGGLEYLVISSESFRSAHQNLSLYYIFRDFHTSLGQSNGRYLDNANEHYRRFKDDWAQINFQYDQSHSGQADNPNERVHKTPVIFLNGGNRPYRRW